MFSKDSVIGIAGSGAMGSGIAQVAALAGHRVIVYDSNNIALKKGSDSLAAGLNKLLEKGKISAEKKENTWSAISFTSNINELSTSNLVIEAIIENPEIKKNLFKQLDEVCSDKCIRATNTSSLSVTSIASACKKPEHFIGIHFFNPAPLMPLVEIIPGIATSPEVTENCKNLIDSWGKTTVLAKDTPGFIVNRVARPFYSEALRIYDEGIADMVTIDWAMKEHGAFKMGPFELMDMIGHDVNYVVTETVWTQMYYDPRFKPSLTQKRLLEAGFLGRKSGRGFYNYAPGTTMPEPLKEKELTTKIFRRVLVMLINEAADALYLQVASAKDLDLAMTRGVNYPKGLLAWADELGLDNVVEGLTSLHDHYEEDRYRISPLLKKYHKDRRRFHP